MSAKIPIGKKSPISWKDSITFAEFDYHTICNCSKKANSIRTTSQTFYHEDFFNFSLDII